MEEIVKQIHKEARMEVLLRAPPGSPLYCAANLDKLYEPSLVWAPRAPSPFEETGLATIRNMQDCIRRHLGSRDIRSIQATDSGQILAGFSGNGCSPASDLPIYNLALNAMDHGIPISGSAY